MKKTILSITLILTLILNIKIESLNDYANNLLAFLSITKKCYKPTQENFLSIFEQENLNYIKDDKIITENGLDNLANIDLLADKLTIPNISHHIYFFTSINPQKINASLLNITIQTLKRLDNFSKSEWKHYIWTNNPSMFLDNSSQNQNIIFKNIEEFDQHILFPHLRDAINSNKITRFSEASDLLRFMALEKYGGIYMDIDYEIYNAKLLLNFMNKFDFIAGRESASKLSYYGSAFMAAKQNHPILKEMINTEIRNYDKNNNDRPPYIKYPCYDAYKIIFNAPPLVTISYLKKNNIDGNKDIILPAWMIYNFGVARAKNIDCSYSNITTESSQKINDNLENFIEKFNSNFEYKLDGNIYYGYKDHNQFPIIGADMFCATWAKNKKRLYHWNFN